MKKTSFFHPSSFILHAQALAPGPRFAVLLGRRVLWLESGNGVTGF
jgi:hypothetical protein